MKSTTQNYVRELLGLDDQISPNVAALALARRLMEGDASTFKAGYTAENAIGAALEVFPDADPDALAQAIAEGVEGVPS